MISRIIGFARPIGIVGVAIVAALAMVNSKPQLQARSIDQPLPPVSALRVEKSTLPVIIVAYGNVKAWRELDLTAQVTGRIIAQAPAFEPGEVVSAGQTLLRIDPTDYELALAEARQALASAELSLADARALRQTARENEAQATVAAAKARIAKAQRDLEFTEVKAPFNAVIDEQRVELGQFITSGTSLGRLLGTDKAEIRLPVPSQDIGFIQSADAGDDAIDVRLYADVGTHELSWQGTLGRIEARVDDQTRVFAVVVDVETPLDTTLHPDPLSFGMFVRAEISGGSLANAVLLPQSALHGDNDVFVLVNGELVRRQVDVVRISRGGALITDGLQDGDLVVTTRLELMFAGMQVQRINE